MMLQHHHLRLVEAPANERIDEEGEQDWTVPVCAAVRREIGHAEELFGRALMAAQMGLTEASLHDLARSLVMQVRAALAAATAARRAAAAGNADVETVLASQALVLLDQLPGRVRLATVLCGTIPSAEGTLLSVTSGIVRRSMVLRVLLGEAGWRNLMEALHHAAVDAAPARTSVMDILSVPRCAMDGIPPSVLSPRERQVLALMAEGLTNREIGARLGIKGITVNTFVSRIFTKLGVENRAAAAAYAVRHGVPMN
jgi:DNA-binding CsgD family transcriptional regulator